VLVRKCHRTTDVRRVGGDRSLAPPGRGGSGRCRTAPRLPGPGEGGMCGGTGDQTDQDSRSASHGAATSLIAMASIESVTLEVADPTAVNRFYTAAFGLGAQVRLRAGM
jgi:hypothetical protein